MDSCLLRLASLSGTPVSSRFRGSSANIIVVVLGFWGRCLSLKVVLVVVTFYAAAVYSPLSGLPDFGRHPHCCNGPSGRLVASLLLLPLWGRKVQAGWACVGWLSTLSLACFSEGSTRFEGLWFVKVLTCSCLIPSDVNRFHHSGSFVLIQ